WQSERVPLMVQGGSQPARQVPIIRDKEGIVRAYLATSSDFVARDLKATLTLRVGGVTSTFDSSKRVQGDSLDSDLASTFDFSLDASQVALDSALAVEIREVGASTPVARYPAQGLAPINGHGIGTKPATMTIVLVPIVINGI